MIGVGQNISQIKQEQKDRKAAEMAATLMAQEQKQLIDTANAPIFGIDQDGLVNEWNKKAAEITGFSPEEAPSVQRASPLHIRQ